LLLARNEIDIEHMLHILEEEALEEQRGLSDYRRGKRLLDLYTLGGTYTNQMQFKNAMVITTYPLAKRLQMKYFAINFKNILEIINEIFEHL
jgi:hypothetical protein